MHASQWFQYDLCPRDPHLLAERRSNWVTGLRPHARSKARLSHRLTQLFSAQLPTPRSAARPLLGCHQSASRAAPAESGRQPVSARARGGVSPAPSQDARRPAAGEVGAARGALEAREAEEERAPASAPPPSGGAGAVAPAEDRRGQGRSSEEGHGGSGSDKRRLGCPTPR